MDVCQIQDDVWIRVPPSRVYAALTRAEDLARWWPKAAASDPTPGGRLALTWFDGGNLETRFESLVPDREVAFPFYGEHVAFALAPERDGTRLRITHRCGTEDSLHIAQSWGFLKANLKAFLESGLDLR